MHSIRPAGFFLLFVAHVSYAQVNVTVSGLGDIEGNEVLFNGNLVHEYLGVPFAEPPVGELRFARPIPKKPWTGTWDATEFGAACPQPPVEGVKISEDCLFLNILVPPNATENNKLPVMVFIPWRGYRVFGSSDYTGREMAVTGSVIIVTISYRFLTFGFFSTEDDTIPGNYGLWDQRMAIEWVRDHIDAFNGDGSRITIVGQGRAGATGAASQILSPLNNNTLFQRAILQSSTCTDTSFISAGGQARRLSRNLMDFLNCNQTAWTERLTCLRQRPWQDIIAAHPGVLGGYFEPRIDGYFFPDTLDHLLEGSLVHQYDVMAGINSEEGAILLNSAIVVEGVFQPVLRDIWNFTYYDNLLRYGSHDKAILVVNAIDDKYQGPLEQISDRDSALRLLFEAYGDEYYISNTIKFLRQHRLSPNTNTYMYYFDYVDPNYVLLNDSARDMTKAVQGEELFYLWDSVYDREPAFPEGSMSASHRTNMIQYWTNFVKDGDPNSDSSPRVPPWPQFNESESYLWISDTGMETEQNLRSEYTSFWLDYIPELTESNDAEQCSLVAPPSDILRGDEPETDEYVVLDISDGTSQLGRVRGILRKADEGVGGLDIRSFRGIPYALPPTGERRFQYSEVLTDWGSDSFRNATEPSPGCPQRPLPVLLAAEYSEDCLYLNIFTPMTHATEDNLPVIVYIQTEQFSFGNGAFVDGTALASYSKAVVVSLEYRLGALGFLSTGDNVAPGNYGIMDVVTALKWIQRFIGSFGGDAGNVTVFGMGSGAHIAHLISLNGLNDGFMHKIIALGDSVLSPPVLTSAERDPLQFAVQLARALDCPTESTPELVSCLRTKSTTDILQARVGGSNIFLTSFYPVWDGTILKYSSDKILASGDYETIPTLLGTIENDNTLITALYLNDSVSDGCPDEQFVGAIIDDVVNIFYDGREEFSSLLRMFYLKSDLSPNVFTDCPPGQQVSELLSDFWFHAPIMETGKLMTKFGKEVYVYSMTFHPESHVYQRFIPPWVQTTFGDDIPYAFGWPYDRRRIMQSNEGYNPEDRKVSINFMEMISSFAKTGIPSANPTDSELDWQPYDPLQYNALHLDVCATQAPIPRAEEKDVFWNTVIAGLKETLLNDHDEPASTMSTAIPCMVGSFIGLEVTSEQAGRIIGALTIATGFIAGLVFIVVFMKLCLMMSRNKSANKPV